MTEDVGVWRGFIWTLDILATVGSIPAPETVGGQIVKVALIVLGVGTLFYGLVTVTEVFVSGHLAELLQERRAQKLIDATSDHYIICGFGRVGRQVARDLRAAGARYVVVDHNPEMRDHAAGHRRALHRGRAVRRRGRCARPASSARAAVIACVDSDAENIFITLTVREPAPRHRDRRARLGGGRSSPSSLRAGADARDLAVQDERRRDGAPRAAPADPRGARGRAGVPDGGDRGRARVGGGRASRSGTSAEVPSSSACATRRTVPAPAARRRPCCTPATS